MKIFPLVVILMSAAGAAAERVSSGPLAIRGPDQGVLGRDTQIALRMRSGVKQVRLATSAGVLGAPVADAGEQRFVLTLPQQRSPQLAVIAAVANDGSIVDWLAIPLAGQARMRVDTEPHARVTVRVADEQFGPVVATASGIADVAIVVPPGFAEATTIALTRSGAVREKTIALGVRPFGRTLAICSPLDGRVR